jgi:hypothetical protein
MVFLFNIDMWNSLILTKQFKSSIMSSDDFFVVPLKYNFVRMFSFITNKKHNQEKKNNANTKTMKAKESLSHKKTQSIYILPSIHRRQSSPTRNAMYGRIIMVEAKRRRTRDMQECDAYVS